MDPYTREKIEGWVGDFCASTRFAALAGAVKEHAAEILVTLLITACEQGVDPDQVSEVQLRSGLVEGVARLRLPESVETEVPQLCRGFLEDLEDQGRVGGGAELGRYVGALRTAYLEAARPRPIETVAAKIHRNDPCPCGSGKKYKKCCMRLLDGD